MKSGAATAKSAGIKAGAMKSAGTATTKSAAGAKAAANAKSAATPGRAAVKSGKATSAQASAANARPRAATTTAGRATAMADGGSGRSRGAGGSSSGGRAGSVGSGNPRSGSTVEPAGSRKILPGRSGAASRSVAMPMNPRMAPPAPVQPPLTPVPTNGKPRKNQAGLNSKELEHFRDLLLQKRREIVGDMSQMEREALRSASGSNLSNLPLHMADMGTDNYEQEFTLGLVEKDRVILREINSALAKIMDGSYGICEGTGKPISKVRLEAQPWARFSIEYARQMEKGFLR
jgi:DnaK suppressor protein